MGGREVINRHVEIIFGLVLKLLLMKTGKIIVVIGNHFTELQTPILNNTRKDFTSRN